MDRIGTIYRAKMMVRYLTVLALITIVIVSAPLSADNGDVPVELQAKLTLAALSYAKNIDKGQETNLEIGVLYFPSVPQSREQAINFSKACEEFRGKTVSGRTITLVVLEYRGRDDLRGKIDQLDLEVMYVSKATLELCKEVTDITRSEKILSCAGMAEYVTNCGVTMAVGLKDNKPKIYFNRSSAQSEGAEFSAKLLRIAELVGEELK